MMVCIYCGKPRELWCRDCGEAHLVTEAEFDEYHEIEADEHDKAALKAALSAGRVIEGVTLEHGYRLSVK